MRLHALELFSGLSAANNGRNWVDVTDGNVRAGESLSIGPENGIHGGLRVGSNVFVASGGSLELRAGTIVKVRFDGAVDAEGNLEVRGTQTEPVLMVDERDDVGGDSNADGNASSPGTNWWRGLRLGVDATGSELEWLELAHGGRFRAGIVVDAVGARFDHCRVRDNSTGGIDLAGTSAPCEFVACTVQDCTGNAIDRVRLDRVGDFRRTVVSGTQNNRLRVTNGTLAADTTIAPENLVGGALFIDAPVTVSDGFTLTLERGVVLQIAFDRLIDVVGALIVDASFELPVIVTSETDTTVVGGSTPGTFNWWRGITFNAPNGASDVRGLVVRNGGRFIPNVNVVAGSVSLREVRSERSARSGFKFDVAPLVSERLAAVDNIGPGFELNAPTADLRQATAIGNSAAGFDAAPAYAGSIRDSIAWGNLGVAFDAPSGTVEFSNGDAALAGANGNIFADPLFVDEAGRDLRLLPGSPSLDASSPLSPLDPDGSPADQGAYPRNDLLPEVFCPQADDAFCEPSLVTLGFASLSSPEPFSVSLVDAPTDAIGLFFYGRGARTQLTGLFGNICVTDPYYRTPVIASGGDPARGPCDGRFEFDAREYLASGIDAGIAPGVTLIGAF